MKTRYNVRLDYSAIVATLHPIEQGNPVRNYTVNRLCDAHAIANAARMGVGLPMVQGIRTLGAGQCYMHGFAVDPLVVEIARVQA